MSEPLRADPTPFFLPGGDVGLLLIHGFTGSPAEMRPLGHYFHAHGLTVCAPLLPGHGTTPDDLNRKRRQDWIDCVEDAWRDLTGRCTTVFVAGLSLGALLTIMLAARQPSLAGIMLYAPAIRVVDWRSYFAPLFKFLSRTASKPRAHFADPSARAQLWAYPVYPTAASHEVLRLMPEARQALPRVHCPTLIVHSLADETIHPRSAQIIYEGLGATDKEIVTLQASGHVITLDCERERVAQESLQFIRRLAPEAAAQQAANG